MSDKGLFVAEVICAVLRDIENGWRYHSATWRQWSHLDCSPATRGRALKELVEAGYLERASERGESASGRYYAGQNLLREIKVTGFRGFDPI